MKQTRGECESQRAGCWRDRLLCLLFLLGFFGGKLGNFTEAIDNYPQMTPTQTHTHKTKPQRQPTSTHNRTSEATNQSSAQIVAFVSVGRGERG